MPRKSRTRGSATLKNRRSTNSYIRSPRRVTFTPMGMPSRSLKFATDFLALAGNGLLAGDRGKVADDGVDNLGVVAALRLQPTLMTTLSSLRNLHARSCSRISSSERERRLFYKNPLSLAMSVSSLLKSLAAVFVFANRALWYRRFSACGRRGWACRTWGRQASPCSRTARPRPSQCRRARPSWRGLTCLVTMLTAFHDDFALFGAHLQAPCPSCPCLVPLMIITVSPVLTCNFCPLSRHLH